jgi:glycosyltransferase involved in cell wall biosynthesis
MTVSKCRGGEHQSLESRDVGRHTIVFGAINPWIGGGIRVLMDLVQHLDRDRFRSVMIGPGAGRLRDWANQQQVPFEVIAKGDWEGSLALCRRTIQVAAVLRRHDASVVHAVGPMGYRALGVAATLTGAVRVCHLGFPPEPGELERSFVAGPDGVVACYDAQAAENRTEVQRIRPRCRVIAVPNGVDTQRFAPGPPSAEMTAIREGFASVVAILGHVSDVKGYPTFLEAAALITRTHKSCLFVCIGAESAQPGALATMKNRVTELGLERNVRFLGFRSDVNEVLRAVDVVTMPSQDEGLPLALLEAMACGRPVVATPVGGIPEVLHDGSAGVLVPRQDARALAEAVRALLDDTDRRTTLGTKARARVEERYSVSRFCRGVEAVYEELLAERRGRFRTAGRATVV